MADIPNRDELVRLLEERAGRALSPAERRQLDAFLDAAVSPPKRGTTSRHVRERLRGFLATAATVTLIAGAWGIVGSLGESHPHVWVLLAAPAAFAVIMASNGGTVLPVLFVVPVSVVVFPVVLMRSGEYLWLVVSGVGFVIVGGLFGRWAAAQESRGLAVNAGFAILGGVVMITLGLVHLVW